MNKRDSNLLAEAYQKVLNEEMPATHGEQGYNEEEITYDQLVAYNNDYGIEDVFDMIYKGVNSGQISYDTYTKFMRTVIE